MKLNDLFLKEATERTDAFYRQQAKELTNFLLNQLFESNIRQLLPFFQKQSERAILEINHSYYDFLVFFQYDSFRLNETDAKVGKSDSDDELIYVIFQGFGDFKDLPNDEFLENSLDRIERKYDQWKTTIFHEMIHVLDFERLNTSLDKLRTTDPDNDFEDYANDSLELNAFYQEAIQEFENILEGKPFSIGELLETKGFDWFKDHIIYKRLPRSIRDSLSEENLRRIKKRLWNYYAEKTESK